ncbi:MAG: gluconokinase [Herpetosiphon sp.]
MQQQAGPYVLVIDVGSSGTRAQVYDVAGNSVPSLDASAPHVMTTTADGGASLDPIAITLACESLLDQIVGNLNQLHGPLVGIASDTLVPNILGLDESDTPITQLLTWGDTRASHDASILQRSLDVEAYHQRTGCFVHSSYVPAKIAWFRRTDPQLFGRVKRWVSLGEYLFLRWFGEPRCSLSTASWSGLLNRLTLQWDTPTLDAIALQTAQLGMLADVGDTSTAWRVAYRDRWPQLQKVPFLPTVGDGVGSNIGSGCTTADRVAVVVATSGAMRVAIAGTPPVLPQGLWCYQVDSKRTVLGGAVSNGANVFDWLSQTLRLPPVDELEQLLSNQLPTSHGLVMLPLLAGERSPGWADNATGAISGLRWSTTPVQILRAAMEGVAYRFALIHQGLDPFLTPDHILVASGRGLTGSAAWCQIMADILGRPIIVSDQIAATARGIAMLAFDVLGIKPIQSPLLGHLPMVQPQAEFSASYEQGLQEQVQLYSRLIERR